MNLHNARTDQVTATSGRCLGRVGRRRWLGRRLSHVTGRRGGGGGSSRRCSRRHRRLVVRRVRRLSSVQLSRVTVRHQELTCFNMQMS